MELISNFISHLLLCNKQPHIGHKAMSPSLVYASAGHVRYTLISAGLAL